MTFTVKQHCTKLAMTVSRFLNGSGIVPVSRLTATIIIANLIGLVILFVGSLGMNQYRDGLIAAKFEGVRAQAQVIADIMAQVAASDSTCSPQNNDGFAPYPESICRVALREDVVNLVFSRLWDSFEGRVRIYNAPQRFSHTTITDAEALLLEDIVLRKGAFEISRLPDIQNTQESWWQHAMGGVRYFLEESRPNSFRAKARGRSLEAELTEAFSSIPGVGERGAASVRYNEDGELVASVSVPIRKVQAVYGVVTAEIGGIDNLLNEARRAIWPFFVLALVAAFLTALLLTATIARPVRRLAVAADQVREDIGRANQVLIPDFTRRKDEIGELSGSLRMMTQAIYKRMAAIESFAADVAHELKNPLTSIRSACETLQIVDTPQAQTTLMAVIQKDVIRMDRLITDISNASRLDAELAREVREVVNIRQLLQEITQMYATMAKPGVPTVQLVGHTTLPPACHVLGSPSALGQVLRNLIDNAVSFSPSDAEVTIECRQVPATNKGHMIEICVVDRGPGIPPDNLENIFERFYTQRPASTGFGNNSGLGLAIARQITMSHAGRLWAENNISPKADGPQGAVFTLQLPLSV